MTGTLMIPENLGLHFDVQFLLCVFRHAVALIKLPKQVYSPHASITRTNSAKNILV